jgi:iron uptake system EfeUOB component EfeO/EfeM
MTIAEYRTKDKRHSLTEQEKKEWEILKTQIASHQAFLANPVTQDFVNILKRRSDNHTQQLLDLVLEKTDVEMEARLRGTIHAIHAHLKILTDSDTFVELLNNKQ